MQAARKSAQATQLKLFPPAMQAPTGGSCRSKSGNRRCVCWRSSFPRMRPEGQGGREAPAMSEKITGRHLERKAILYVRQSSAYHVHHNLESQKLQYAMQARL